MTETIEQKALALVNEVRVEAKRPPFDESLCGETFTALCRAIEQHEAFRQEVSEAVEGCALTPAAEARLSRFIISQPDPLVEALEEWINSHDLDDAASFRAALAARGLKIVEDK